eukprot:scaffold268788_cov31-Tisochrysis_lutea.AAC.3
MDELAQAGETRAHVLMKLHLPAVTLRLTVHKCVPAHGLEESHEARQPWIVSIVTSLLHACRKLLGPTMGGIFRWGAIGQSVGGLSNELTSICCRCFCTQ